MTLDIHCARNIHTEILSLYYSIGTREDKRNNTLYWVLGSAARVIEGGKRTIM